MRNRASKYQERIYALIQGAGNHMTAEEVWEKAKKIDASIGIATVYRQLNRLAAQKKILRIRDQDQGYIYDGNGIPHHHFHCRICGSYRDLPLDYSETLDRQIERMTGAIVESHQTIFEGICQHCKELM